MTWEKQHVWRDWNINIRPVCLIDNANTAQCPADFGGKWIRSARFTENRGWVLAEADVHLTYPFGGTHTAIAVDLPLPTRRWAEPQEMGVGQWVMKGNTTSTSCGPILLYQGWDGVSMRLRPVAHRNDTWAKANLTYDDLFTTNNRPDNHGIAGYCTQYQSDNLSWSRLSYESASSSGFVTNKTLEIGLFLSYNIWYAD